MAKSEKSTKTKSVTRTKVSKLDKAVRKLSGTSAKTPFSMKTAQFTVTGYANQPVEIPGYLLERSELFTVWRHKATSASKKMVVSTFRNTDIVEVLGDEKGGSITIMQRRVAVTATGTLKFNGQDIVIRGEGGTSVFSPNSTIQYEIKAADTEGSQASGRGVKSEGEKKKAKVVDIKDGKKKKAKK